MWLLKSSIESGFRVQQNTSPLAGDSALNRSIYNIYHEDVSMLIVYQKKKECPFDVGLDLLLDMPLIELHIVSFIYVSTGSGGSVRAIQGSLLMKLFIHFEFRLS